MSHEPGLEVRDAASGDLRAILGIYNDVILRTTAVYSDEPTTIDERGSWLALKRARGHPVLVAHRGGEVVGFASLGEFRAWPCYARSVEHSVHVREDQRRAGVGSTLVAALIDRARALGMHTIIAGVDRENEDSLSMHRRLGFEEVGTLREVGRKFGRWLDLTFMQLRLDD